MSMGLAENALALQSRVSLLEVEVQDKRQTIGTLKHTLGEAKGQEKRALQELTREWDEKLQKQRAHYEASLERQLKLVDRLLNDKTELTKRCELFAEELKAVERKFQMKMEEMDETSTKEITRQKQNWQAAERLRRESWEKEKTREIKEMTIKGLQPEVERILAERKQEKQRLEERHREEIERQRRELLEQGEARLRESREQLLRDHERALDAEREAHRRKAREEFEKHTEVLSEERSKCAADLLAERRKLDQLKQHEAERSQTAMGDAVSAERVKAEAALREARAALLDEQDRHREELGALESRSLAERAEWQRGHEEQSRAALERSEAAIREGLDRERGRQLDHVMDRLGREHIEQQRIAEQRSAANVEQVRAEAEGAVARLQAQLVDSRVQVAALEERYGCLEKSGQASKGAADSAAERCTELEKEIKSLEADVAAVRAEAERALERHRDELWRASEEKERETQRCREEVSKKSAELSDERARGEEQLKDGKRREEQLMSDLEARVKRTLHAKDEQLLEMRNRCAASENKARELEYLLVRQREELLSGLAKEALA